ncbi:MAG: hypothetical protein ISS57_07945 [Anaerolineales bacterium]|nr:hypothetical protein [Anaerolineales bacterium]
MTQNDPNKIPAKTVQSLNALRALFGDEEQTIVVKVDEHEQLLGYEVRPLADVVADLAINGFGKEKRGA